MKSIPLSRLPSRIRQDTGKPPPLTYHALWHLAAGGRMAGAFQADNGRWHLRTDAYPELLVQLASEKDLKASGSHNPLVD